MAEQTGYDLEVRDPNNINDHLKVSFEDVIGEPDGTHSIDCVWKAAYKCFTCSKGCCYNFLTIICGIPLALCWGCQFACISFKHIWYYTPCLRIFGTYMGCAQKFFASCLNCCLAPLCESCALCFSKIMVHNK